MTATHTDYGNRILEFLKQEYPLGSTYSTRTNGVLLGIDVDNTKRPQVLKVLHALAAAGYVEKIEGYGGKFRWRMARDGWDPVVVARIKGVSTPRPSTNGHAAATIVQQVVDDARLTDAWAQIELLTRKQGELEQGLSRVAGEVNTTRVVEVRRPKQKTIKLTGTVPAYFEKVIQLASMRRNVLLVGPAGCGKTTVAKMAAEALGLEFGKVGGSAGLSEVDLLGRHTPNLTGGKARFETTAFLTRYEEGGLCLIDELDAGDPNVFIALNPALDRTAMLPVPKRADNPVAERHPDFVCVATANTYGRGATRVYAGRNQLDEATLDRFRIGVVECDYDPGVEAAVCPDDTLRAYLQAVRRFVDENNLRRVVSTRFLEDAYVMVSEGGWGLADVKKALFSGWAEDETARAARAGVI